MILQKLVKPSLKYKQNIQIIIISEAYKTRYHNRTTHMKTKMQHVYLHVHATISTKGKGQATGPVPKPPIKKVQINKNHYCRRSLVHYQTCT